MLSKKIIFQYSASTLWALFLFFFSSSIAFASNEFSTTLINTQTVDLKGSTHVEKKFTLKNKLSTVYIKKYGVEINSNKLTNIKVRNQGNLINANVVQTDTSTTIGIDFPDEIVGKDKERTFSIEYDDPDAAIILGNVLEVYSPKIADPENFDHYEAILKIPSKFGLPTIANPTTYSLETEGDFTVLNFDREGEKEGISVIFGEKQFFDFSLDYSLENPTRSRGLIQIALPPDTSFQKVQYSDIKPRPESIEVDEDGNWIATYLLEGDQTMTVNAKGIATIHLEPTVDVPVIQPQVRHIQPDIHWESKDPLIQNIAQKYKTPHEIFNYVVDTLTYNYDRIASNIDRPGAKATLENVTNAVCQEFTDVFIAIARANTIPARQATGYAFTNNPQIRPLSLVKDVLHAWPEYFDEERQQWIPVDPTWTNTTGGIDYFNHLDFSHFVFTYQGVSSEKPYPAGSYKTGDDQGKTVFVTVTDQEPTVEQQLGLEIKQPFTSLFNLLGKHTLLITNQTGTAWYRIPVSIQVPSTVNTSLSSTEIERILPYQTVEIPFSLVGNNWLKTQPENISVSVGTETAMHQVIASSKLQQLNITPEYIAYFAGSFVFTTVLVFCVLFIIKKIVKQRSTQT